MGMQALFDEVGLITVVNRCEAHEPIRSKNDTPGRSITAYGWKHQLMDRMLGLIGYPQERSHDIVSVGRRPDA